MSEEFGLDYEVSSPDLVESNLNSVMQDVHGEPVADLGDYASDKVDPLIQLLMSRLVGGNEQQDSIPPEILMAALQSTREPMAQYMDIPKTETISDESRGYGSQYRMQSSSTPAPDKLAADLSNIGGRQLNNGMWDVFGKTLAYDPQSGNMVQVGQGGGQGGKGLTWANFMDKMSSPQGLGAIAAMVLSAQQAGAANKQAEKFAKQQNASVGQARQDQRDFMNKSRGNYTSPMNLDLSKYGQQTARLPGQFTGA